MPLIQVSHFQHRHPKSKNPVNQTNDEAINQEKVKDGRYSRSPHKYDFRGIDSGSSVRKPRTANQRANDAKLRSLGRDAFVPGAQQLGGYYW